MLAETCFNDVCNKSLSAPIQGRAGDKETKGDSERSGRGWAYAWAMITVPIGEFFFSSMTLLNIVGLLSRCCCCYCCCCLQCPNHQPILHSHQPLVQL
jgi:hypothetical protein